MSKVPLYTFEAGARVWDRTAHTVAARSALGYLTYKKTHPPRPLP